MDPSRKFSAGRFGAVIAAIGLASSLAFAQPASQGPIKLIVPFTPGTGIDLIARQVGPHLSERLGRPVIVDNKAGASGNLGTQEAVRAPADGSTFLVTVNTVVMNRALYPKLAFDPLRDLAPVSLTSWGQLLLVSSKESGIETAQQLVERAKARPGALNYGSPGAGTPHHLAMELWKNQTKTSLTHVPYRGTGPAVTDLLGGTIDVMFLPIHVALQHVKAGNLKALAISSRKAQRLAARRAATAPAQARRDRRGDVVRHPRAQGHAQARGRPAEPGAQGHPRAARREDGLRDPGHGAGVTARPRSSRP